jgi:hypothetical protein
MKGILKIYHPEETLKYHIQHSYCKAVYLNEQNLLELEIITDEDLDHVEDDSLQYNFPQISLQISDFPVDSSELVGKIFDIQDFEDEIYTEVDLFDDEEALLHQNKLSFSEDENGELQLIWEGKIDDFYTGKDELISFKLKCHFQPDTPEIDED